MCDRLKRYKRDPVDNARRMGVCSLDMSGKQGTRSASYLDVRQSSREFCDALRDLIPDGMSLRSLAQATRQGGGGMSAAHLSRLARGLDPPSVAAMEAIADALGANPSYFAEYRLAAGRALLDEHGPDGLDGALRRLQRLQAEADGPLPRPPGRRTRLAA